MENAKYLRGCVRLQTSFGRQCSELLQRLYVNEFMLDVFDKMDSKNPNKEDKKKKDEEEDFYTKVVISSVKIVLPSPASLNTTNLNDQISAAQPIVDNILQAVFIEENAEQSMEFKIMKKKLYKHFVRNLDWEKIESLLNESKIEASREKIVNQKEEEEGSSSSF